MLRLCMLAVTVVAAMAQVPFPGECPDVQLQSNFVINQYVGVWYEIEKYPYYPEERQKCIRAEYTYGRSEISVKNTGIYEWGIDNRYVSVEGRATQDLDNPAKWSVKYAEFPGVPGGPYWIWDTDYNTYSLVLSCRNYFQTQYGTNTI